MRHPIALLAGALTCVLLLHSANSSAHPYLGSDLMQGLAAHDRALDGRDSGTDAVDGGMALGYVMGVSDALRSPIVCVPPNSTNRQFAAVVKLYLRNHPEEWNEEAFGLVVKALSQAFPCHPN